MRKSITYTSQNADLVYFGLKTRTRRIIKNAPEEASMVRHFPYGNIGDELVVKEPYTQMGYWTRDLSPKNRRQFGLSWDFTGVDGVVKYAVDPNALTKVDLQNPSKVQLYQRKAIFMPWELSRTTVKITDLIICNVNDMSDEDCFDEGIIEINGLYGMPWSKPEELRRTPVQAYADLWESINGEGSWSNNDLVFDIAFEKIGVLLLDKLPIV